MSSPLQRLYRSKFILLAVVSAFAGVVLMFLARWAGEQAGDGWLKGLPINDVGLLLFGTGLFGVLFQYVGHRDSEEENIRRIQNVIADDFASKPDGLVRMVSSETRERIIQNCLGMQLGDTQLAHDLYQDIRQQVITAAERWHDVRVAISLSPWPDGPGSGRGSMFVATIRRSYRVVPSSPVMRFACVSDPDEYRELVRDPTSNVVWYFEPLAGLLDASSPGVFELTELAIDGTQQRIRRMKRAGATVFTVDVWGDEQDWPREVTVEYTYRVLVQRITHLIELGVGKPCKGLDIQLWYGDCGIRYMNVVDLIASAQEPRITRSSASDPKPMVQVTFDGWVFPKSGVAFVWVLDEEAKSRVNAGH